MRRQQASFSDATSALISHGNWQLPERNITLSAFPLLLLLCFYTLPSVRELEVHGCDWKVPTGPGILGVGRGEGAMKPTRDSSSAFH